MPLSTSPRLGLALGAGGARGLCHIGVLRELDARSEGPDVIAGASSGAVIGAAYAAGRLDALEDWARSITRIGALRMWDLRPGSGGLIKGQALAKLFEHAGLPERFEDLDRPLVVVATDMRTGAEVWFREGSLFDALRASISLPGILSPHYYQDRWFLDGGIVNPIPISATRALGADLVISSNPNTRLDGVVWRDQRPVGHDADRELDATASRAGSLLAGIGKMFEGPNGARSPSYVEVLTASIEIMTDHIQRSRLAGDPPHVQLNGTLGHLSISDFGRAAEAIEEGRQMVRRQAEFIDELMANRA